MTASPWEVPPQEVPLGDSIATHLLQRVFLWYLVVAALVTGGYLAYLHHEARTEIEHQLRLYEASFADGMELHLWNLERRDMDALTSGMLKLPYVVGVAVTQAETGDWFSTAGVYVDAAGRRTGVSTPNDTPLIAHRFDLHHNRGVETMWLGTATFYSDTAVIWAAVRLDYLLVIGAALVKTVALWLIFLWYSRRHLHRPLHDLTQAAARIQLDNLEPVSIDLKGHRGDELAALTTSFNIMLRKLLAARRALEAANAGLERTVQERTRDLKESRRRLSTLIHNLPGVAYRCRADAHWTLEFISVGCLDATGYGTELFLNQPGPGVVRLIRTEDQPSVAERLQRAIATDRPYHFLYRITHRSGETRWMWEQGQAIKGEDGGIAALEGLVSDVTEHHQAELAAKAARREAECANQAKSRFLANMSHEFRTPLNAILGFTDILLRQEAWGEARDETREHLETVHRSGQALLSLVDDILDIARAEAGKIRIEPRPFRLAPLLGEVVQMVQPRAETKGLALHLDLPEEDETLADALLLDPGRLRQVLLNLLSNAVKFTALGEVRLTARSAWLNPAHSLAWLQIEVLDTGTGIPPEERERIFEPFEQLSGENDLSYESGVGGTGLGLAISRQLVEVMGGDLQAERREGGGSLFRLTLPEVEVLARAVIEPADDLPGTVDGLGGLRFAPARVLIADDQSANRQLLRIWLEDAGLSCEEAVNGDEALARISDTPPDAALIDLKMPGLDGAEVARRLRSQGVAYPLIAVTAKALPEEIESQREAFDAWLTKPVGRNALYVCLARYLAHQETGPSTHATTDQAAPADQDRAELIPPDVPTLAELRQLACLGLTGQIEVRAAALERRDPHHEAFARELLRLARTFDRQALLDYLAGFEP